MGGERRMKLKLVGLVLAIVMLAMIFAPAIAAYISVPPSATVVIDIRYNVINDQDMSWGSWDWAVTNYLARVTVWRLADGSYLAKKTYTGTFYVPKGAKSPVAGTIQPIAGQGELNSWYEVSFTGTLKTGLQYKGYLGFKDFGGSFAGVLSGTSGVPGGFGWMGTYFSGTAGVTYNYDIWTYRLWDDPTSTAWNLVETGVFPNHYNSPPGPAPIATGDIIT
jgi:hypothetical protein